MRKCKFFMIIFTISMFVFLPVNASENSTTVRYMFEQNDTGVLLLEVDGNGCVNDGMQTIKNGSVEYVLKIGFIKEFKLIPEKGYKVAHAYYAVTTNSKDSEIEYLDKKDQIIDGSLNVQVVDGMTRLKISFEKLQEDDMLDSKDVPSSSNAHTSLNPGIDIKNLPNTGEHRTLIFYVMIGLSYCTLLHARNKARKEWLAYK